jgi:hypothetical protein
MQVHGNLFIGSPIAYVGVVRVEVVNNTFYRPGNWVIRILQESVDPERFLACGDNAFRNNIIHYGAVSTEVNVGANTRPESFVLSNNLWFHEPNPSRTPVLPVRDADAITGRDPGFKDAMAGDFSLATGSPAIGAGFPAARPERDFLGRSFASPRSIGAFEGSPAGSSILRFRSNPPGSRNSHWMPGGRLPGRAAIPFLVSGEAILLPDGRRLDAPPE